ncbi:MAG: hypothetical protein HQL37_09910 [Alphaproteobacteria bacterium]|nr:hypothetical protein [Alphaproteobacteria bacterium]
MLLHGHQRRRVSHDADDELVSDGSRSVGLAWEHGQKASRDEDKLFPEPHLRHST